LQELRDQKAEVAFLEVVEGNDPAFNLYKGMGFDPFTKSAEYHFQKELSSSAEPIPQGYKLTPLSRFDWQTRFAFAKRVTPEHIKRYEPVVETRFRTPKILPLFGMLFESAGGSHSERFAIYAPNDEVVGIGNYSYRTRSGGTNMTKVSIDPNHAILAGFILHYVFSEIQQVSAGRRVILSFDDWESALIDCAEAIGCDKRFGSHRMGLRF
jgi:hypothetical protein